MAVDALVKRHLAPPANPVTEFRIQYLPLLTTVVAQAFNHRCAFDDEAWRVGRGTAKLMQIEESIQTDELSFDRVNMMLKKEVNIVPFDKPELPKKARAIQFCTNLRTAYENATAQHSMCHALSEATEHEVTYRNIKCRVLYTAAMTPKQIAEFATEAEAHRAQYPCSFLDERDGKNWDANVQTPHRWRIAEWYGTFSRKLEEIAKAAIKVKGAYAQGNVKISYKVNGTVKSGHWDTSSGNAALNLEVTMQAIGNLPASIRPSEVRGLIMGDDLLLWLYFSQAVEPAVYAREINIAEAALGIQPVRGLFTDVLNVSFCSMTFYWTRSHGLAIVPKLGRTFAKLFWTVTPLQNRSPARLASTIAHAFYPLYHEYEPMRVFLKHHMGVPPIEMEWTSALPYAMREGVIDTWPGINWAEGNAVKYGLLNSTLSEMSELLSGLGSGGIDHPAVNIMIAQDTADPPERRGLLA